MKSEIDDPLTGKVIGVAIGVHRELGPGFLESVYEEAVAIGLVDSGLPFQRQVTVPVLFRGQQVGEHRLDLIVASAVVVELKAIKAFEDVHYAVVRSYLRATGLKFGLLINFAAPTLQVKRIGAEFRSTI
ncbi:GxxExxY protein [Horticoccus sp. 23ND18S-11]|uniref:GxxExxY protein n=1 Tax=Horticoccus sp. 23ND18S-11 TaxID=3391832 RepID=UPI0039C9C578